MSVYICSERMIDSSAFEAVYAENMKYMSQPVLDLQILGVLDFKGDRPALNILIHSSENM